MDIVCLGEVLIDMFPAEIGRRLADVSAFRPKPGGAPANVAVAAHRLGADSAFIGKVGDDAFGMHLMEVLRGEGVETRGMRTDPDARTTMAIIAMLDENTAEFIFYRNPGADQRLRADELDTGLLRSTRALHIGSLSLTHEPVRSATYEAVRTAREAGALVSFDVNYRPSLWSSPEAALAEITAMIPHTDLLKVNEVELGLLTNGKWSTLAHARSAGVVNGQLPEKQAVEPLLARGPSLVVVTLGRLGSYFCSREGSGFVPAFAVETVDAVGCGDAFIAGVLCQLTAAADWRRELTADRLGQVLRYANAVGALTATKQGVIPALPITAQVEAFLAEHS